MTLGSPPISRRIGGPPGVFGGLAAVGNLLDRPGVAVGIAEEDECTPGEGLHFSYLQAPAQQLSAGGVDVRYHELQSAERTGSAVNEPLAERDRTGRARRRQLHEPQLVVDGVIMIELETHLVDIEGNRAIGIGDGHGHQLKLEVHRTVLSSRYCFGRINPRTARMVQPSLDWTVQFGVFSEMIPWLFHAAGGNL